MSNAMDTHTLEQAEDWAEAAEARVLVAALTLAPRLGWNRTLVVGAARGAGLSSADAELLLPGGARDLSALLFRRHDARALTALARVDPETLKIRERIARAVQARVEAAAADEDAVRRSALFLSRPSQLALGARLLWDSADTLWRWAGDEATDENHYSKRAILSAILASTLAARLSSGPAAAREHLARRIDQVIAFEKWKANAPSPLNLMTELAQALGRLRYGVAGVTAAEDAPLLALPPPA